MRDRMPPTNNKLDETWLVLNVYDAAMAWAAKTARNLDGLPVSSELDPEELALFDACRRAKEGQ